MRRKDREIVDAREIVKIMKRCDVCRLAINDDGFPYLVPLNFGLTFDGTKIALFFHGATEGRKIELLRADPRASFEMDCEHRLQYFAEKGYCTFSYESVVGRGRVSFLEGAEKDAALRAIMDRYHPAQNAWYNPAATSRTLVYKLDVDKVVGKRKAPKKEI